MTEHVDDKKLRKILVCKSYGGYSLSNVCHEELLRLNHPIAVEEQKDQVAYAAKPYGKFDSTLYKDDWGRHYDRDDAMLIEVVERLGCDVCSGSHCKLGITEIPWNVNWGIHEYDGQEYVEEVHRSW